jgi:hypothetical protein
MLMVLLVNDKIGTIKLNFICFRKPQLNICYVIFEVFMVVTKNAVFWDIKTQFVPHRRHIKFPLQSPAS